MVAIGIVTGVVTTIIVLLFYCLAKKKGWLSSYRSSGTTTNQRNPESSSCEPGDCQLQGLCENMQDAEFDQVVKKAPEIGKATTLYHTITRNN